MMTEPIEAVEIEEELSSEVRHNILLCWTCSKGNTISRTPVELVGRLVTTLCERFVRYEIVLQWCEDCVTIRNGGVWFNECGICGNEVVL